jgi:glycosyltransferase involved in cell wall biosynthesis
MQTKSGSLNGKPTVAHFIASDVMGGVEIATLRLTAATHAQFRHVAFLWPGAVVLRDLFEKQGIETMTYSPPTPSLRHGVRFYQQSKAVARQLRNVEADIVHFADKFAAYYTSFAAYLAHTKTICHVRLSHPQLTWRDRLSLLPVGNYIFVSAEAMNTFGIPLPASRKRVIYDAFPVDTADVTQSNASVRREFGIEPDCVLVGSVARVAPQKDFPTLVSAAAQVLSRHPGTRFLIIGEHSSNNSHRAHYDAVLKQLEDLNIKDSFIFTGYRNDVQRLLAATDISVLCTHREGFPLSILESMALGKPVIATAVGGVPEIIRHGVTGFLHKHGDSKELAEEIMFLIEDPTEAARIGRAGVEVIRRDYCLEKYAGEISQAYRDAMCR